MKKKLTTALAALLCLVLLWTALPVYASADRVVHFVDVPQGAWYLDAVIDLVSRGIMGGKTTNTFAPTDTLTREEFVTMMARTALSEGELNEYRYQGRFSDVSQGHWSNRYINWATEAGIVSGVGSGRFNPTGQLTRQDMAVMVNNFAKATGLELPVKNSPQLFLDYRSIANYAAASVTACQRAGIITGYSDMTFKPTGNAKRQEAAQLYSRFLKLSTSAGYNLIHKRMNGVAISAVEFDPSNFTAGIALGNDRVRGAENVKSIVNRTGAKIAVNAAFFDLDSYTPYGTMIDGGGLITTFNRYSPAKSAITMDSSGRFSVENFTTQVSVTAINSQGEWQEATSVGVNVLPGSNDSTRLIFTRDWGSSLGFSAKYAAALDTYGNVTAIYRDQDAPIPSNGCLLIQRAPKTDDSFWDLAFDTGAVVDVDIDYVGSSTQDIQLSIGVGPKIVQNGQPYGNGDTYAAEGLLHINNYGNEERVCIGVKYDGSLVILHAYTSLPELSKIMVAMGCESAVNLDGGGSANLYAGGKWLTGPRDRLLNNMLYFR